MIGGKASFETTRTYEHPLYDVLLATPGLSVATASIDQLLTWGTKNALWVFPMATSCCGIELMAAAASRVDLDRMGTIVRGTPRQADVMVVAGTITVKMAPRVLKLWEQMPEPKWCLAMGSCAISGDFYRNLYSVVPGIDTFLPVDVYVPGCPPNPEALMAGLMRLQEKITAQREGRSLVPETNPDTMRVTQPSLPRLQDAARTPELDAAQAENARTTTDRETLADVAAVAPAALSTGDAPSLAALPASTDAVDDLLARITTSEMSKNGAELVAPAQHLAVARALKSGGYRQLVYVVASHWPAGKGRGGADATLPEHYEVSFGVRTSGRASKVAAWSVRVPCADSLPSLAAIYAGADWQEREQFDLVGVHFAGHPDLRRLMLPADYVGHPLRREIPADAPCAPWR